MFSDLKALSVDHGCSLPVYFYLAENRKLTFF
jgi:hypothetical protein